MQISADAEFERVADCRLQPRTPYFTPCIAVSSRPGGNYVHAAPRWSVCDGDAHGVGDPARLCLSYQPPPPGHRGSYRSAPNRPRSHAVRSTPREGSSAETNPRTVGVQPPLCVHHVGGLLHAGGRNASQLENDFPRPCAWPSGRWVRSHAAHDRTGPPGASPLERVVNRSLRDPTLESGWDRRSSGAVIRT